MTVINTNVGALVSRTYAVQANNRMETSMERLSSGLRINSAADDAAGLAVANKMEAQIRGVNMAIRNSQDGISLVQTAESGMSEVTNMVIRMRELAVQMNNGVYTAADRTNAQLEVTALLNEIDKIAENTAFNEVKVLDGTYSTDIRAGNTNPEVINVKIDSVKTTSLGKTIDMDPNSTATGSDSNYSVLSSTGTATVTEADQIVIAAPTATSLQGQFAAMSGYSGGSYAAGSNSSSMFDIDASTGEITSNQAISYNSGGNNTYTIVRDYTSADGSRTFSESITLTVTEDTSQSLVRAATSAFTVEQSDAVTINAVDPSSVTGGALNTSVTRGALSSELATFINTAQAAGQTGTFSLDTASQANFTVDSATGQITTNSSYDLSTSPSAITLTYTAGQDSFTETINLTVSGHTKNANTFAFSQGDSGDITFDLTDATNYVSAAFNTARTAAGSLTMEIANVSAAAEAVRVNAGATNITGTNFTLDKDVADGTSFDIIIKDGGTETFRETVTIDKTDATTSSSFTSSTTAFATGADINTDVAVVLSGTDGDFLNYSLSGSNVSDEFNLAVARNNNITYRLASAVTNVNAGATAMASNNLQIDGDLTAGATTTVTVEVVSGGNTIHTEELDITVTAGASNSITSAVESTTLSDHDQFNTVTTNTANVALTGRSTDSFQFDMTSADNVSQEFLDAVTRIGTDGGTVTYSLASTFGSTPSGTGTANALAEVNGGSANVAGTSFEIRGDVSATQTIEIEVSDGTDTYHIERITLSNTAVTATTSGSAARTVALNAQKTFVNTDATVTNNTSTGLDHQNNATLGAITAGADATADSALAATEANQVRFSQSNLSQQFNAFITANASGHFSLKGTDAALFTIEQNTGLVKGRGLDFEKPTDSNKDNVYNFTVVYTKGDDSFEEDIALSISDFANEQGDSVATVNVSTQSGAATAVEILDRAINQMSGQEARMGAAQNRLEFTLDRLNISTMVAETARGRVIDADFARETSELSKQQILSQAATSMLAQANQSKQMILSLVR